MGQASALASGQYILRLSRHSTVTASSTTIITARLTENDLNHIKRMTGLATGTVNTYIRMDAASISDLSNNPVAEISDGDSIRASSLRVDSTDVQLVNFDVEM